MVANADDSGEKVGDDTSWTKNMVERARDGDRLAFNRLADRFQPEIYRMIYYRTRSEMDAQDLCQDVFLKAFKSIRALKSPAVFRSWLYRIAVNRVKDYYRKKQFTSLFRFSSTDEESFQEPPEMAVASQGEKRVERKDFWRQIRQMTEALSHVEREVFMLRFFDELSIQEIGATLKKNESTVKTHLYRALKKVKEAASGMDGVLEALL
jgi:RNA polymerase sigma-70 factor (ECF subfamily)